MQKQGEQAAGVPELPESGRRVLGGHQHHKGLAEVPGYLLEHEAVVRVDDHEERLSGERVQVPGVQTVGLLAALQTLAAGTDAPVVRWLPHRGRQHAAQVVAH